MTNDVKIITKKSLKKNITKGLAVGAGIFLIYGTFNYLGGALHRSDCRSKIEKAIEKKDCDLADKLIEISVQGKGVSDLEFEEYKSKVKLLRHDCAKEKILDHIHNQKFSLAEKLVHDFETKGVIPNVESDGFLLDIKRIQKTDEFSEALRGYKVNDAKKILNELRDLKIYSTSDMFKFEALIQSKTPDGLFEKIGKTNYKFRDGFPRSELCKDYLSVYPNGKHRERVTQILLIDDFQRILDITPGDIKHNTYSFGHVSDSLKNLNDDLKLYGSQGLGISKIISIEEVVSKLRTFLDERSGEMVDMDSARIGDRVRVVEHKPEGWGRAYYEERKSNFPVGTEGYIITKNDRGDFFVDFDSNKTYPWTSDWLPSYKDNIALFKPGELRLIVKKDPIKLKQFEYEIETLEKLYNSKLK